LIIFIHQKMIETHKKEKKYSNNKEHIKHTALKHDRLFTVHIVKFILLFMKLSLNNSDKQWPLF